MVRKAMKSKKKDSKRQKDAKVSKLDGCILACKKRSDIKEKKKTEKAKETRQSKGWQKQFEKRETSTILAGGSKPERKKA